MKENDCSKLQQEAATLLAKISFFRMNKKHRVPKEVFDYLDSMELEVLEMY